MHKSEQETLSPEIWQKQFATAECCALLLAELEALIELHKNVETTPPIFIAQSQETLEKLLHKEFWNQKTKSFSNCYLREEKCTNFGLHEFLPLLTNHLKAEQRNILLAQLKKLLGITDSKRTH